MSISALLQRRQPSVGRDKLLANSSRIVSFPHALVEHLRQLEAHTSLLINWDGLVGSIPSYAYYLVDAMCLAAHGSRYFKRASLDLDVTAFLYVVVRIFSHLRHAATSCLHTWAASSKLCI